MSCAVSDVQNAIQFQIIIRQKRSAVYAKFKEILKEKMPNRRLLGPARQPIAHRQGRRPGHQPSGIGGMQMKGVLQVQQHHGAI